MGLVIVLCSVPDCQNHMEEPMKTLSKITLVASALAFTTAPAFALDGHTDAEKAAKAEKMKMKAKCKDMAKAENAEMSDALVKAAVKKCMKEWRDAKKAEKRAKKMMEKAAEEAPSS
jgi:hypothetical protein